MSIFKSLDTTGSSQQDRMMPKFDNIEYTIKTFVDKLNSIDQLTDQEVQNIIYRQYGLLLNYDLFLENNESRAVAQEMFTNSKFLNNLICCVGNIALSEHQIICCNKIAYDYIAYHNAADCNQETRGLLLELSYRVNFKTVLALSAIVGLEAAKYIAMLRKSSFKEDLNISRVNRYLIKSGLELKAQDMMNIYAKLFERVSNLFIVTMLDMPEEDNTKLENFRYDEMSKCMIDILDSMPSVEIRKVLENYAAVYFLKGEPKVRFSFKDLHSSYTRIKQVIYDMDLDGTIVP